MDDLTKHLRKPGMLIVFVMISIFFALSLKAQQSEYPVDFDIELPVSKGASVRARLNITVKDGSVKNYGFTIPNNRNIVSHIPDYSNLPTNLQKLRDENNTNSKKNVRIRTPQSFEQLP